LGGIRASSQTVSYEVILTLLLFISILFFNKINLRIKNINIYLLTLPLIIIWVITLVRETNRAPFDFREGERELISGFNIEYGARGFTLFFLAEYSIIIFFSLFLSNLINRKWFIFITILYIIIQIRTSFPRFRYDFLISLIWFKLLPFRCLLLILLRRF
jgi:NADH-ubiquinone oxidoreductase chain 1